jgi:hypothetical protein
MQKKQHKLTIFLGDVEPYLADLATTFDPSAWLLDHSTYKKFLNSELNCNTTVYTSLGDLPDDLEIVHFLLTQADTIVYCPPVVWSDNKKVEFTDPGTSIQGLTEIMLCILPNSIKIENFKPVLPLDVIPLVDKRKCNKPQLWSVGCSITHGSGVDLQQRYGQLLADELDLQCSFLTRVGSAIDWAADQILRSDIREKDLVVWGLTNPERLTFVHNNQLLKGVNIRSYEQYPEYKKIVDPFNLYLQNTIYQHFYAIQQVINYCKKIKANLILVELLTGNHSIQRIFNGHANYVKVDYNYTFEDSCTNIQFIDIGTDKLHPGPEQHKKYKEIILKKLNQLEIL